MSRAILVCGGAGYIGSHTATELLERGYNVIIADNLEKGHREAVPADAAFENGDLRDGQFLENIFRKNKIDAVIDFAAYSLVGESVADPLKYYENNLYGTMNLLKAMRTGGVGHIVFSSTAAVYGIPDNVPIVETAKTNPINPYGETKLAVEKMLKWADEAYGIKYAALRYFNVAGAHKSGKIGEDHIPETHLIPNIILSALNNKVVRIFGNDYNTHDGTCIRDYIHVTDLADAHILAVEKIFKTNESVAYNLGNGKGFSNKEILETAMKVSELDIKYEYVERRPGDPDILIASSEKAALELGWQPKSANLEVIIESALKWHKDHPNGFNDK